MAFPYRLIDLTHTLHADIPSWSGGCGFHHEVQLDYDACKGEDKFRVMKIRMHAGVGTHMDAPSHGVAGGKCVHSFDVNELCMPCVVIDVSQKMHERYSLLVEDIEMFEKQHGQIAAGVGVLVYTGWSQYWNDPIHYINKHIFPSILADAAQLLHDKGVMALGIDTISPDRPEDGFPVHRLFLGAGKFLIENAANLKEMPAIGAYMMALPLKVKDGTEAPLRLVGLV